VNLFFDTSVLVAASSAGHVHHPQAFAALNLIRAEGNQGWMSQHSVAEVYAILTSAPLTPRIHPTQALRILEDNLLPHFRVVALEPTDYQEVIRELAAADWRSGKVYDALHIRCARKQPIDRLYTFNVKDFQALAPKELHDKIAAP
jgi:predicted nucleic acid-binding protein